MEYKFMWSGNPGPLIRQKAKGTRPKRNLDKRIARRKILPGFPISPRPFSVADIEAYLSGDKIVCLLCGKSYKKLVPHLKRIHNVLKDEYKDMYGLPWRKELICEESKNNYANWISKGKTLKGNTDMKKVYKAPRRKLQPFRYEIFMQNLNKKKV